MTKLEIIYRLGREGVKTQKLLKDSKISNNRLMKLKKAELEQFLKAYETINNLVSKCVVENRSKPSPCNKCGVSDKVACCGCREYFEWRDQ